jgi:hypothetical protein
LGWNTSTPFTFTRICPFPVDTVLGLQDVDVGLAEDYKQVPLPGVFQVLGHVQIGVHAGLEHGHAAELAELGGVGVVVEGAGHEHVEAGVPGFAGGGDQVSPLHGSELRADEDRGPAFGFAFQVLPFGAHVIAEPGGERVKDDLVLLVGLLHAGGL